MKDAFHEFLVHGRSDAVNPEVRARRRRFITRSMCRRMARRSSACGSRRRPDPHRPADDWFGDGFARQLQQSRDEANEFYDVTIPSHITGDARHVIRQAAAGLLWTKQFYHYVVKDWLEGDPGYPSPAAERARGRNHDWTHLYNRDVISVPDKWEYPWYAAWDLAFHMIPLREARSGVREGPARAVPA